MKRSFGIIVACDLNYGIGNKGVLPWERLKRDMAHFKAITKQDGKKNAVIMGRKTWESLSKPLEGRLNIVMSRNHDIDNESVVVARCKADVMSMTYEYDNVWVIGGSDIYRLFLEHTHTIYMTRILKEYECDVHLPSIDYHDYLLDETVEEEEDDVRYYIMKYTHRTV